MDKFRIVKKRERRKRNKEEYDESSPSYFIKFIKKVEILLEELETEPFVSEAVRCFEKSIALLENGRVKRIICYGIGSVSNAKSSVYQFCLIYKLSQLFACSLNLFDPVFTEVDENFFKSMKCLILPEDDKGLRNVNDLTLFFLPHSPRFIMENILISNWGKSLSNCVLFGDNLMSIVENTPTRILQTEHPFMNESQFFVDVIPVENNFKYSDVFNDFAFHIFIPSKISAVDERTWDLKEIRGTTNCPPL